MNALLLVPFGLQMAVMFTDELYCHRRRGLPRWERAGHPLDTLSVLSCYVAALVLAPSSGNLTLYAGLALLSCVFVTKDEFVHAKRCSAFEHWLHALLFLLHPIVLSAAAAFWLDGQQLLLAVLAVLTAGFGAYQTLYWNGPWLRQTDP